MLDQIFQDVLMQKIRLDPNRIRKIHNLNNCTKKKQTKKQNNTPTNKQINKQTKPR